MGRPSGHAQNTKANSLVTKLRPGQWLGQTRDARCPTQKLFGCASGTPSRRRRSAPYVGETSTRPLTAAANGICRQVGARRAGCMEHSHDTGPRRVGVGRADSDYTPIRLPSGTLRTNGIDDRRSCNRLGHRELLRPDRFVRPNSSSSAASRRSRGCFVEKQKKWPAARRHHVAAQRSFAACGQGDHKKISPRSRTGVRRFNGAHRTARMTLAI